MVGNELLDILEIKGERKKYAQVHGIDSLPNRFNNNFWNDEDMFKKCNEKGITWQEYLGVDENYGKKKGKIY